MHVAVRISYSVIEKAVCCMSCNHLLALKMAGVACRGLQCVQKIQG